MSKRKSIMQEYNIMIINAVEAYLTANNPVSEKIAVRNIFRLQKTILSSRLRRDDKDILLGTISDTIIKMCNCVTYAKSDRLVDEINVPVFN